MRNTELVTKLMKRPKSIFHIQDLKILLALHVCVTDTLDTVIFYLYLFPFPFQIWARQKRTTLMTHKLYVLSKCLQEVLCFGGDMG